MHHIVKKRESHQAYTLSEAAEYCGMSIGSLQWHKMKGRIPIGEIIVDHFRFYSRRQLELLKDFYNNRGIYEHMR